MSTQVYGALAQFDSAAAIYEASKKVRAASYTRWDAHTPFPVHGLDTAMGVSRTKLPIVVFLMGLTGASLAMLLQWWTSAVDYKLIIAAKPYFSWQAFIPITFEVMILFSAGTTVVGMLFANRLPEWHHSLLKSEWFAQATDDKFFISIEKGDPKFDSQATPEFLRSLGATRVELVEE